MKAAKSVTRRPAPIDGAQAALILGSQPSHPVTTTVYLSPVIMVHLGQIANHWKVNAAEALARICESLPTLDAIIDTWVDIENGSRSELRSAIGTKMEPDNHPAEHEMGGGR